MTSTFWCTLDIGSLEQEGSGLRELSSSYVSPPLPLSLLPQRTLRLACSLPSTCSVTGNAFPVFPWDAGYTELLLQLVLEALLMGSSVTFALAERTVEHGFGHVRVLHT